MSYRFSSAPGKNGIFVLDQATGEVRFISELGSKQVSPPWTNSPSKQIQSFHSQSKQVWSDENFKLDELKQDTIQTAENLPVGSNKFDWEVVNTYPYMIASTYQTFLQETDARLKCKLMVDTFTALLKYWAIQLASEYFKADGVKDLSVNKSLKRDLSRPLISAWNILISTVLPVLRQAEIKLFSPELERCYQTLESKCKERFLVTKQYSDSEGELRTKVKKLGKIQAMISYRNGLAHGFNQTPKQAQKELDTYHPLLRDILKESRFLVKYPLFVLDTSDNQSSEKRIKARRLMGASPSDEPVELQLPQYMDESSSLFIYDEKSNDYLPLYTFFVFDDAQDNSLLGQDKDIFLFEGITKNTVIYISAHGEHVEQSFKFSQWQKLLKSKALDLKVLNPNNLTYDRLLAISKHLSNQTLEAVIQSGKYIREISVGRADLATHLDQFIHGKYNAFLLGGESGIGKTTLLSKFVDEQMQASQIVLFYRASTLIDTNISNRILRDLGMSRHFFEELLALLDPLLSAEKKQFYLVIDALNEFQGSFKDLLRHLEDLVLQCANYPWMKIVMSVRDSSYSRLSKRYHLGSKAMELYYTIEQEIGTEKVKTSLISLQALSLDELEPMVEAYRKYLQPDLDDLSEMGIYRFRTLNAFKDLSPKGETRLLLRHPLMARLILETFHRKVLPNDLHHDHAMKLYLKRVIVEEGNPKGSFHERKRFLKYLTNELDSVSTDSIKREILIDQPKLKEALLNTQKDSPYVQLLDLGVLLEEWENDECFVRFSFDRLFEFFLTDKYDQTIEKAIDLIPLLERASQFANLIGVVESILLRACHSSRYDLVTDLLTSEFPNEETKDRALKLCVDLLIRLSCNSPVIYQQVLDRFTATPSEHDMHVLTQLCDHLKFSGEMKAFYQTIQVLEEEAIALDQAYYLAYVYYKKGRYYNLMGENDQAFSFYERAVEFAEKSDQLSLVARLSILKADLLLSTKGASEALPYVHIAIEQYTKLNNQVGLAHSYKLLATIKYKQGDLVAAEQECRNSLEMAEKVVDKLLVSKLLNNLGVIKKHLGDIKASQEFLRRSLNIIRELGARPLLATSLANVATNMLDIGQKLEAERHLLEAMSIAKDIGFVKQQAGVSVKLGTLYLRSALLDKAETYFQNSLVLYRNLGHQSGISECLDHLGRVSVERGEIELAYKYFEEALAISRSLNEAILEATILDHIGHLKRIEGHYHEALEYHQKSLGLGEKTGEQKGIADSLYHLGSTKLKLKDYSNAYTALSQSLKIRKGLSSKFDIGDTLNVLGTIAKRMGKLDEADDFYQQSLEIKKELEDHKGVFIAQYNIGALAEINGDLLKAVDYFQRGYNEVERLGYHSRLSHFKRTIGKTLFKLGQVEQGIQFLEEALQFSQEKNNQTEEASCFRVLGHISLRQGDLDLSMQRFQASLEIEKERQKDELINFAQTQVLWIQMLCGDEEQAALDFNSIYEVEDTHTENNIEQIILYQWLQWKLTSEHSEKDCQRLFELQTLPFVHLELRFLAGWVGLMLICDQQEQEFNWKESNIDFINSNLSTLKSFKDQLNTEWEHSLYVIAQERTMRLINKVDQVSKKPSQKKAQKNKGTKG